MLLTLASVSVLAAASLAPTSAGDPPQVIATTSIWADVVGQLDCADQFAVDALIPAGGDPHSYEPSMTDRDRLGDAALVVRNGAGLEETLADTLATVADDGTPVFAVADHVTLRSNETGAAHASHDEAHDEEDHEGDGSLPHDDHDDGDHDDEAHEEDHEGEDDHDHGAFDPHLWLDPTRVIEALPALSDALVTAGADPDVTTGCADELGASLEQVDAEIAALVEEIPAERRLLVTNHDALGYFADRYGFEVLGSVLPSTSTLVEASPSELDELAAAIDEAGVPAIFTDALEAADEATALGNRLGIEVVPLYTGSLGEPGSGADTYQSMLLADATAITTALGDR